MALQRPGALAGPPDPPPPHRTRDKSLLVSHRRIKNQRLATVGYIRAFAALTASPGAYAHYQRPRATGDAHTAALRNSFNRLLGCLQTGQLCRETAAFAPPPRQQQPTPA